METVIVADYPAYILDSIVGGFSLGCSFWLISYGVYRAFRGFWDMISP